MKKLLISIFITTTLFSSSTSYYNGLQKQKEIMHGDYSKGQLIFLYKNKNVKEIISYKDHSKELLDYVKHGKHYLFDSKGYLVKVFNYSNNTKDGEFLEYYPNTGILKIRGSYLNGKLDKFYMKYDSNGRLFVEVWYINGKPLKGVYYKTASDYRSLTKKELKKYAKQ